MTIKISALGHLKKFLPEEKEVKLSSNSTDVKNLFVELVGIPRTEPGVCYIVNGKIQNANYLPQAGDSIVALKVGGAG